ncbi:hypothetical protein Ccrd_026011, partial [Cynara cardunculus var. scolymus]
SVCVCERVCECECVCVCEAAATPYSPKPFALCFEILTSLSLIPIIKSNPLSIIFQIDIFSPSFISKFRSNFAVKTSNFKMPINKEPATPPMIGKIGPYTVFVTPPPTPKPSSEPSIASVSELPKRKNVSPSPVKFSPPIQPPVAKSAPPVLPPPVQYEKSASAYDSKYGFFWDAVAKVQNEASPAFPDRLMDGTLVAGRYNNGMYSGDGQTGNRLRLQLR